jgi:hypothetical protein
MGGSSSVKRTTSQKNYPKPKNAARRNLGPEPQNDYLDPNAPQKNNFGGTENKPQQNLFLPNGQMIPMYQENASTTKTNAAGVKLPATTVPAPNAVGAASPQTTVAQPNQPIPSMPEQAQIQAPAPVPAEPVMNKPAVAAAMQANQTSSGANQFMAPSLNGITFGGS